VHSGFLPEGLTYKAGKTRKKNHREINSMNLEKLIERVIQNSPPVSVGVVMAHSILNVKTSHPISMK
jgi:hypothetical protein